jgi:hypothetical protein
MKTNETTDQITDQDPTPRQRVLSRRLALRLASAVLAFLAVLIVPMAQPASAASSITPASNLICERYDNKLSISPPRVWASYRTEQVGWGVTIQRWNSNRRTWVNYSTNYFYGSFNYYGMNVTSWSGGWYHNNTMNIPVYRSGYYRAYSAVMGNQGGVRQEGWVSGGGSCYVY